MQESRDVYIFPDIPHCVKNMRNHTLDYDMVIKHGDSINIELTKAHFAQLISCDGDSAVKPQISFDFC